MRSLFTTLLITLAAMTAWSATIDPTKYGELKQADVANCGEFACGPAAAVNSFVMLQNMYPHVYDSALVGLTPDPPHHFQKLAADLLSMPEYMDTCCARGTPMEKFITGKEKYIEERIPGKTTYGAYMDRDWDLVRSGGAAKPPYVRERQPPPQAWLESQIEEGEDVELLIEYTAGRAGAHWLTLFSFSMEDQEANFIDPLTGQPLPEAAVYQIVERPVGFGRRRYVELTWAPDPTQPDELVSAVITGAVSESPVPEPGTALLLLVGAATVCCIQRKTGVAIRR